MAILNNNPLVGASGNQGGYNINNSVRLRSSASAYLSRTPASAGNRKTWTWSAWVKRGALGSNQSLFSARPQSGAGFTFLRFVSDTNPDTITFADNNGASLVTSALHRDVAAWYHIVLSIDTTQATASNRVRIYVNGNQVTAFSTATYPSQNLDMSINNNINHWLANNSDGAGSLINFFDGYMAEVNFIDGQAKVASDFGETDTTTGVWKPKAYSGTYGTNGFYLKFSDIATTSGSNAGLGKDFSGNTNYWTTNNISVTAGTTYDAMTDSPTNTSATASNFATLNPLVKSFQGSGIANGNLSMISAAGNWEIALSTISASTGKYYCEVTISSGGNNNMFGVFNPTQPTWNSGTYNLTGGTVALFPGWQQVIINGSASGSFGAMNAGDNIGMALDLNASTITYYKNGSLIGGGAVSLPSNMIGIPLCFAVWSAETGSATHINFGQRPFSYTPPTGYLALNTFNLPNPTILQGNKYMDATLWTGTGTNLNVVNAGQFKPDLVWIKNRNTTNYNNLFDSVRGVQKALYSNATDAEATETQGLLAFNSNGFNIGTNGGTNGSGNGIVAWQWQAGQGSTSSNTSGSITSTVSVNTTAGFSIVTYTGTGANATIGHGLGVAPKMVIVKNRSSNSDWLVQNANLSSYAYALILSGANAQNNAANWWNSTAPTSSVFSVGDGSIAVNGSGSGMVAYCWAEIAGFSKFGSYTGNGSTDGVFVYLGFRPKFIITKVYSTSGYNWNMYDSSRGTYNVADQVLIANGSGAEETGFDPIDFLSNGFKLRMGNRGSNVSGASYIYMAFAENPTKFALAR